VPFNEPGKLMLFELYADAAAFAAHSEGASIARYRAEVRPKISRVTSYKCHFGNELPS
jgi:quinol monooxygenase YgiN